MIFLIPFGGVALAAWMYFGGQFLPEGRNHKGNLLSPTLTLEAFQAANLNADVLDGKWGILVVADGECGETCKNSLYLTRQAHIALNRNSTRMSRFLVSDTAPQPELQTFIDAEHDGLTVVKGAMPSLSHGSEGSVRIFLTDPLGNVMLWYNEEHTGKQILKDMEKLLKTSRIG
ncbi:hypothetical protein [Sansalvadorimonas verongulae]|uniref:hypothetical protein n=1 Tax=Sansalvadorimonas verongulae TaxID=2172824 RepID=UPI0012BB9532|nr:hypothetical protein [Sansalvadorimonas verongulae]MTI14933.1 hypothetical protein [Sansalvadorimonas verongulae]